MDERSCATCGWGVQWTRSSLDGRLHGRCRFVPSIPLPKGMLFPSFGEETPMPTLCPGWKKPKRDALVPRWGEEWDAFLSRGIVYFEQQLSEIRQKRKELESRVIAEDPEMAAKLGLI